MIERGGFATSFFIWESSSYKVKILREDAHAKAEKNVALRRFGGAKYAFTRIPSCICCSQIA